MKRLILVLFIMLVTASFVNAGSLVIQFKQTNAVTGDYWEIAKNGIKFATINYISGQTQYEQDLSGMTINPSSDVLSVRTVGSDGYSSEWVDGVYKIKEAPTDVIIYYKE